MFLSSALVSALLAAFVAVSTVRYIYSRYFSRCALPASLPWIGAEDDACFSRARATLRSFWHTRELVFEGYEKYSKKELPFVLPNINTGPEVILPMSQMQWLLKQKETVLDQNEVNRSFLQADYTMLHPKVVTDTVHEDVIRQELTKMLGNYTADVIDEIDYAFKKTWGVNTTEWKEITSYYSMLDIVSRISNRVIVGFPLCRDEDYLANAKEFARWVVVEAAFIAMVPKTLKGIFAPLIRFLDLKYHWKTSKVNDYIQWSIDHSYARNDPSLRTVDIINKRLSVIQFAVIQSSTITLANLILDLAAAPDISVYFAHIRTEVLAELKAAGGQWTKDALARMVCLDSVLRESMRMWGFVSRGVMKQVVAKDGVTLPSGQHLPRGTKVGVHGAPVHRDENIYSDAQVFKPFRFCSNGSENMVDDYSEKVVGKGIPLVTTSSNFMAFSHGRNACPGRFFAAQQLKLVLAYIALNYEIAPIPSRPANLWFINTQGPPLDAKISIRRRVGTV
ncbi:cytochrome P450 [Hyaloscypha variabilis F]|uniref:Cytochrome P450 n=1 Tax=Hyaloscypha variabilis (strain UAMH 11265 / GT02V1 / F) TaxID=1149755 RepID=A0A2J6QZC2_HYAVF|nr:cytochrome P450 [Hyaloscypha variabilis F]